MPTRFEGTREARMEKMDRLGVRCDANNRNCVNRAVEVYDLIRLDGHGNRISDEPVSKKCCGRHRAQFLLSANWQLVGRRECVSTEQPTPRRRIA